MASSSILAVAASALFIPGLHGRLLHDLAVLELDHGDTEHLAALGIGAGLRERQAIAVGEGRLDVMGHGPAADIVPVLADRGFASDLARLARRVVTVDE